MSGTGPGPDKRGKWPTHHKRSFLDQWNLDQSTDFILSCQAGHMSEKSIKLGLTCLMCDHGEKMSGEKDSESQNIKGKASQHMASQKSLRFLVIDAVTCFLVLVFIFCNLCFFKWYIYICSYWNQTKFPLHKVWWLREAAQIGFKNDHTCEKVTVWQNSNWSSNRFIGKTKKTKNVCGDQKLDLFIWRNPLWTTWPARCEAILIQLTELTILDARIG